MSFIINTFSDLNWFAIILAFLTTMPIGFLWYSPRYGFGKPWMKLANVSMDDAENTNMGAAFGPMMLIQFLTALVLACLIHALPISGLWDAVGFGVVVGVVLRGGSQWVHNGFTMKPLKLTLIDTGFDLVSILAMSIVLGLWL